MKIENLSFTAQGYVTCHSNFYSSHNTLDEKQYFLKPGVNSFVGDIDSEGWTISYLLSMYHVSPKDFALSSLLQITVNDNVVMDYESFSHYVCYLDRSFPLFSDNVSVKELVSDGMRAHGMVRTPSIQSEEDIRILFGLDKERFERPLRGTGNEIYQAMAAIGYCHGKQVFCFPWFSAARFRHFEYRLNYLLNLLNELNMIVVSPVGKNE